eukprot:scaffold22736_cov111-Cylindrotheca_fusiformis.AAC.2
MGVAKHEKSKLLSTVAKQAKQKLRQEQIRANDRAVSRRRKPLRRGSQTAYMLFKDCYKVTAHEASKDIVSRDVSTASALLDLLNTNEEQESSSSSCCQSKTINNPGNINCGCTNGATDRFIATLRVILCNAIVFPRGACIVAVRWDFDQCFARVDGFLQRWGDTGCNKASSPST